MLLWMLAIGVPIIVALLVLTVAWLNGTGEVRLASVADAAERLAAEDLSFKSDALSGVLASGGRYALVPAREGARLGLVAAHGAQLTTRVLPPSRLISLESVDECALRLRLDEPGWPSMRLVFADKSTCAHWHARLAEHALGQGRQAGC